MGRNSINFQPLFNWAFIHKSITLAQFCQITVISNNWCVSVDMLNPKKKYIQKWNAFGGLFLVNLSFYTFFRSSGRGRPLLNDRHPRTLVPPVQPPPVAPNLYPPSLFPPPQHTLPHLPGVVPPQFPMQFPQGQQLPPPFNMPPPGYPPAPTNVPSPWVPPGTQPPLTNPPVPPIPAAHLLSKEEFYRQQRRLKEEYVNCSCFLFVNLLNYEWWLLPWTQNIPY